MVITLTKAQEAWIAERVARGEYASAEEAARSLIDAEIATQAALAHDDMAWAKPLIDQAEESIARGEFITAEELSAELKAQLKALKGQ